MERIVAFGLLSLPIIILSWRTLFSFKSHGFFRFFSWECILWLLIANLNYWFDHPFSISQLFSWIFLIISLYLVIGGVYQLKKGVRGDKRGDEKVLYQFEKTCELVDTGIYKYIRHPLYSSLFFLTWGIFLKQTTNILLIVSFMSTAFLFLTSIADEKECIRFFGENYRRYMKRTKRFIPFVF
jgi:protein-S-isoprenylcysteine O-methyltransferase Ste14